MTEPQEVRTREAMSPRALARLTGIFFLLTIACGVAAQMGLSARFVVAGDAAATADRLRVQGHLVELAFSLYMAEMLCQLVTIGAFYALLRPAGPFVARLALLFGSAGVAVKTVSRIFLLAPLTVLGAASWLDAFTPEQRQAMALLSMNLNDRTAGIALAFFGAETMVRGYLILRSTFLPRLLGGIGILSGLGWLTFISPSLGMRLFAPVAGVGLIGSAVTIGWLLIRGVDEQRWRAAAR